MEKFIMAAGCAVRIYDSGTPRMPKAVECGSDSEPVQPGKNAAECCIPIVLLHGYLESLDIWDDFIKLLKPYARVVAMDLPGHGISEVKGEVHTMEFLADTLHGVLTSLGIDRCITVGHSMGGYTALEFMRKYSEKVAGIVLFHSVSDPDTEEKREMRKREIAVVEAGKKDLLAANAAKSFAVGNRKRMIAKIEELAEQTILTEDAGVLALLRGMGMRHDNNHVLQASLIPQLFIFGRWDEYIPVAYAESVIAKNPQAETVWLENSGHAGFIEEPAKSAETILDFSRKVCGY